MAKAALAFGPYLLEERARILRRDGVPLPVTLRHVSLLHCLASNAGTPISKDVLIAAAWGDVNVNDNSVEQAIFRLRRLLGARPDGQPYIETVSRLGYKFTSAVQHVATRETDSALDAILAPDRHFVEGRDALARLQHADVDTADTSFRCVVAARPDDCLARAGLANACRFKFEATRVDDHPDVGALNEARMHAEEACRLDSDCAEGWAALSTVLHAFGADTAAVVAARHAVGLEPSNWRHVLRLAWVSWGEGRLRAAERALQMLPGLALAHWFAATVHVARQAFPAAARHLDAGSRAQDAQHQHDARFGAVGLHWLRGLVRLHYGDEAGALDAFQRELIFEHIAEHIHAREACANAWYAIGASHVRRGAREEALAAFDQARLRVPNHLMASAGRVMLGAGSLATLHAAIRSRSQAADVEPPFEIALAKAVGHIAAGRQAAAVDIIRHTLNQAASFSAGWLIPVEPLLHVAVAPDAWAEVLTALRTRAA